MLDLSNPNALSHEMIRTVGQQMLLLLHAVACMKKDDENTELMRTGQYPIHPICNLPHCAVFKLLIAHARQCRNAPECPRAWCTSSKIIMHHWKYCRDGQCVLCTQIRRHHH